MFRLRNLISKYALVFIWGVSFYETFCQIYSTTIDENSWGLQVALILLQLLIVFFLTVTGSNTNLSDKKNLVFKEWLQVGIIFIGGAFLQAHYLTFLGIVTSEVKIMEDVILVLSGNFFNPFSNSADFPSRYLSYLAVIPAYLISNIQVAIRTIGIVSNLLFSFLLMKTCSLTTGRNLPIVMIFPIFSLWTISLNGRADNNWISLVPLLCLAHFYIYLKIPISNYLIPLFALFSALCFWTLYVPIISAAAVILFFLFNRKISRSNKYQFILWFIPFTLPLVGRIIAKPLTSLDRHLQYLTQSGEANLGINILEGYSRSIVKTFELLMPNSNTAALIDRNIFLEPITLCLIFVGVIFSFCKRSWNKNIVISIFLLLLLTFSGFILSNPVLSFWRTVVIYPAIFIYSGLGLQILFDLFKNSLILRKTLLTVITITHILSFWFLSLTPYALHNAHRENFSKEVFSREAVTQKLYEKCLADHQNNIWLFVPKDAPIQIILALSRGNLISRGRDDDVEIRSRNMQDKPIKETKARLIMPVTDETLYDKVLCDVRAMSGEALAFIVPEPSSP